MTAIIHDPSTIFRTDLDAIQEPQFIIAFPSQDFNSKDVIQ